MLGLITSQLAQNIWNSLSRAMPDSRSRLAYCLSILSQWSFHFSKAFSLSDSRLSHALAFSGSCLGLYSRSSCLTSSAAAPFGSSASAIVIPQLVLGDLTRHAIDLLGALRHHALEFVVLERGQHQHRQQQLGLLRVCLQQRQQRITGEVRLLLHDRLSQCHRCSPSTLRYDRAPRANASRCGVNGPKGTCTTSHIAMPRSFL